MTSFKTPLPIKLFSTVIGMSSVLVSLPVIAGTPSSVTSSDRADTRIAQVDESEAQEEELSPEAMKILCTNFPLNSRCAGTSQSDTASPTTEATPDAEGAADDSEAIEPNDSDPSDSTAPDMDSSPDMESEEPPVDRSEDSSTTDDMNESPEGGAEQPDGTMNSPEEGADSPDTMPPANTMPDESTTPDGTQAPASPPMVPVPEGGTE